MIRFGIFLRISFNASFFSVSSELAPFSRFMADLSHFSMYPKLAKNLKFSSVSKLEAFWKLLVTRQIITNFLILLMKLIASLPKPLGFKCNPPLLSSFEVIFPLSMTSICKPCKCSFVLITVKEALPLSVLVIKLRMKTLLSGKVCSINFFRVSNLSRTILDGSLTVLLVPTCNIILSGHFFNSGLGVIVHAIDRSTREVFNFDLSIFFWNSSFFNARQHRITNYKSGISIPFMKVFISFRWYMGCFNFFKLLLLVSYEIQWVGFRS